MLSGIISHDACNDVFYIAGALVAPWSVEGFHFSYINATFIGMHKSLFGPHYTNRVSLGTKPNISASYEWKGIIAGSAFAEMIEALVTVEIEADSVVFLQPFSFLLMLIYLIAGRITRN